MSASEEQVRQSADDLKLQQVQDRVAEPMRRVDQYIRQCLDSDVVLIRQVAEYIIGSGGKRLRPIIHLLASQALGYRGDHHVRLAAIIEFIHTATLLHDDVVDESDRRRGRETANSVWGNSASVLVGDFLYSRAFQMMVEVDSMRIMDILAETTNTIAEGEVMQLLHLGNPETSEQAYLEVIRCKTAKLFEAAGRLAAVLNDAPPAMEESLGRYGAQLGLAFQLADDMLDYSGDAEELGKNVGDDLAEGKPTLPLIRVLEVGDEAERSLIRAVLSGGGIDRMEQVRQAIDRCDALEYVQQRARTHSDDALAALEILPESEHKELLAFLARFACRRSR